MTFPLFDNNKFEWKNFHCILCEELEVSKYATNEEIRKGYERKKRALDENRYISDEKRKKYKKELQSCYDILIDPERRFQYETRLYKYYNGSNSY